MLRQAVRAGLLLGAAACARPSVAVNDPDDLITVTRTTTGGKVTVSVSPARAGLALNAKSPPRFLATSGTESVLGGPIDPSGEKFKGSASATLVAEPGTLRVSVCDSAAGICRKAEVAISE